MATRRRDGGTTRVDDPIRSDEEEPRTKTVSVVGIKARRPVPEAEVPAHLLRRAACIFLVGMAATFLILLY